MRRRVLFVLPLAIFCVVVIISAIALQETIMGTRDTR